MLILRDEKKMQQRKRISQILSVVGMVVLIAGFILGLRNFVGAQLISLAAGFLLSQVAVYMAHRYVRTPRPDQLLDDALRKGVANGRMYHFLLPAPHVLLTPSGPIIFHVKYQAGDISVSKDGKGRDKWRQKRIGFFRRFFGQESLGNPTREAEILVEGMANFLRKNAPEVAENEIPLGVLIIFTHSQISRNKKNNKEVRVPANLELKASTFTAMHVSKLRGYLRSNRMGEPLPADTYAALQAAFDKKAGHLLAQDQELQPEEA